MKKVISFSWGELEAEGSNFGDTAIFQAQYNSFLNMNVELGVLSANVTRTKKRFSGVRCFDVDKGRLKAIVAAIRWADIIVVGGGELVQDVSSLFYSPFNLIPLFLAFILQKKSYAWAIGIGQKAELAWWTPILLKLALWKCSGITLRDRGSFNTLYKLGFREPKIVLTADCALTLPIEKKTSSSVLGIAPRNVSNRQRKILPLELRKKMKNYVEPNPRPVAIAWAKLLNSFCKENPVEKIILFPFHAGTLSNDDFSFCTLIKSLMSTKISIVVADASKTEEFLEQISSCKVLVSTPLHGLILSLVAGTIPVSVSYSSKCNRFMELAGLEFLLADEKAGEPTNSVYNILEKVWNDENKIAKQLPRVTEKLVSRAKKTEVNFRRVFGL